MNQQLNVNTGNQVEFRDITAQVRETVAASSINNGLVFLFVPHTTAAVTINENADPDVVTDMINSLDKLIPRDDNYRHYEGNSAAHLKSSLVGASETIAITNGDLQLGTWQGIYFCEFDGPRSRKINIKIIEG